MGECSSAMAKSIVSARAMKLRKNRAAQRSSMWTGALFSRGLLMHTHIWFLPEIALMISSAALAAKLTNKSPKRVAGSGQRLKKGAPRTKESFSPKERNAHSGFCVPERQPSKQNLATV